MYRTYQFRLCPTKTQAVLLAEQLETLRRIYNGCLAERKEAYEKEKRQISGNDQRKAISAIRNAQIAAQRRGEQTPQWYARVSAVSIRDTIGRLDGAFKHFFRRI